MPVYLQHFEVKLFYSPRGRVFNLSPLNWPMVDGNFEFGGWGEEEGEQHFNLIGHVWMICENTLLPEKSELHCQFANLQ